MQDQEWLVKKGLIYQGILDWVKKKNYLTSKQVAFLRKNGYPIPPVRIFESK